MESRFESEYADDLMPDLSASRLTNAQVEALADAEPPWTQMAMVLTTTIQRAVLNYYVAKRFSETFSSVIHGDVDAGRVGQAMVDMKNSLWRTAVNDIMAVIDVAAKNPSLAGSLTQVLRRAKNTLESQSPLPLSEIAQIKTIIKSVDPTAHSELDYLRYLRNKWSAHPALDRHFDDWGGADRTAHGVVLEAALVRVVNATQEAAIFIQSSDRLTDFRQPLGQVDADGRQQLAFDLTQVSLWASMIRDGVGKNFAALHSVVSPALANVARW